MEWISVEERLPENDAIVLIRHKQGICLGRLSNDNKWHSTRYPKMSLNSVSLWCAIPEVPLTKCQIKNRKRKEKEQNKKEYPENLISVLWGERNIDEIGFNADMSIIKERLEKMLDTLFPREKDALLFRFRDNMTQLQVGDIFGVTRERAHQIEAKALRKLRHPTKRSFIRDGIDIEAERLKALELVKTQKEEKIVNLQFDKIGIEHLDLSARSYNCLKRAGYDTLKEILVLTDADFWRIRNMGSRSINEVKEKIKPYRMECE